MTRRTVTASLTLAVLLGLTTSSLRAGGFLETFDITAAPPASLPGHVLARLVPIRWDDRMLPVRYSMNSLDPIPNPLGAPVLSLTQARDALQSSLDAWNAIPTSYVQMQITGTVANAGSRGFDFKNELTFRTPANFGAIASSPSVTLIADVTLTGGTDIDGDGDSDVSSAIASSADVDADGDIEMPAGFYKAGTILDNDVQFNTKPLSPPPPAPQTSGFRFTVGDAAIDTNVRSVDLMAVAVHEFGHSIGLSHTLDNQTSATDGTGTTMFPFIDTGDPASELSQRHLGSDDIAWASYHYPEGSKSSGLAALQAGDVAFANIYGLIQGDIRHGVLNQPIAGASVAAYDWNTRALVAAGFSGTVRLPFNPSTGALPAPTSAADNILDGKYTIPAPKGSYAVGIEAVDGAPVSAGSISLTAQVGAFLGQQNFNEEFFNNQLEETNEVRPGQAKNVVVKTGKVTGDVDITTNRNLNINNFDTLNAFGFVNSPAGRYYAVRIPAAQITTLLASVPPASQLSLHSALFATGAVDASVLPVFARAMLTTGSATGATASINLAEPLAVMSGFLGQDTDFTPFYLPQGHALAKAVIRGREDGSITDLFLVLQLPDLPFPGVSGIPPLIGLDVVGPFRGLSYMSNDGVTFAQVTTFDFTFSLAWSELE